MLRIVLLVLAGLTILSYGWKFNKNPTGNSVIPKSLKVPAIVAGAVLSFGAISFTDATFNQNSNAAHAKIATSIFVGEYNDPNHPGCLRKISVKGKDVTLIGSDDIDGSKQWRISATEDFPGTIFVDFSPKGGPKNLLGVYDEEGGGIKVIKKLLLFIGKCFVV